MRSERRDWSFQPTIDETVTSSLPYASTYLVYMRAT
jgi:hypothetical protein